VQDAADYLHDLSTRAQVDPDPVTDWAAVIRWCAQQIHSMGGDADVERAAEYLDDLATEADESGKLQPEFCAHCGEPIRRVTGTLAAWWVHDPDGHTACNPDHAARSHRATPTAKEQQDEPQP
jgi:hypothetical protein